MLLQISEQPHVSNYHHCTMTGSSCTDLFTGRHRLVIRKFQHVNSWIGIILFQSSLHRCWCHEPIFIAFLILCGKKQYFHRIGFISASYYSQYKRLFASKQGYLFLRFCLHFSSIYLSCRYLSIVQFPADLVIRGSVFDNLLESHHYFNILFENAGYANDNPTNDGRFTRQFTLNTELKRALSVEMNTQEAKVLCLK